MHVDPALSAVVDGSDAYVFHANTDTHYDVVLDGRTVAEVDFFYGIVAPEVGHTLLTQKLTTELVRVWGRYLACVRRQSTGGGRIVTPGTHESSPSGAKTERPPAESGWSFLMSSSLRR